MYASMNFPTKRDFRRAVAEGQPIVLYSPVMQMPAINGVVTVEGPWPERSTAGPTVPRLLGTREARWRTALKGWTAQVRVQDMRIVEVH